MTARLLGLYVQLCILYFGADKVAARNDSAPIIARPLSRSYSVRIGATISITCAAQGDSHTMINISWFRESDHTILDNSTNSRVTVYEESQIQEGLSTTVQSTIVFHTTEIEDESDYTCIAANEFGNDRVTFSVDVEEPAQIIVASAFITVPEGTTALIACTAYGDSPVNIRWVRESDHTFLDNSTNSRVTVYGRALTGEGLGSAQSILEIHHVEKEDEGNYTCVAANKFGSDNKTFKVFVKDPAPIVARPLSRSYSVRIGAAISITCVAQRDSHTMINISWFRESDHTILDNSTNSRVTVYEESQLQEGLSTTVRSTIVFHNIEIEDESDYTCMAANEFGSDRVTFSVDVEEPAQIIVASALITVPEGTTALIACTAYGDSPVNIRWVRESDYTFLDNSTNSRVTVYGRALTGEGLGSAQSILEIHHVEKEDEGNYTCVAVNEFGSDNKTYKVIVKEPAQIVTILPTTPRSVDEVTTVSIACVAHGESPVNISWVRGSDHMLLNSSSHSRISIHEHPVMSEGHTATQSILEIRDVQKEDQSNYTCIAVNEFGNDTGTYEVKEPAQVIVMPDSYMGCRGATASITCTAYGELPLKIIWRRETDKTVLDNSTTTARVTVNDTTVTDEGLTYLQSILEIQRMESKDQSNYTCFASNSFGGDRKVVEVFVRGLAQIITEAAFYSVVRGDTVSIACVTCGGPSVNISWLRESDHTVLDNSTNSRVTVYEEPVTVEGLTSIQSTLMIRRVEEEDESNYTCVAANEFGNDRDTVEVSVKGTGNSDKQTSNTIIITATLVGATLAIIACLIVAAVLIISRRMSRHKHKLAEGPQEILGGDVLMNQQHTTPARYSVALPREELAGASKATDSSLTGTDPTMAKARKILGRYVQLMDIIGSGEYGVVYRAHLKGWSDNVTGDIVAVKTLKGSLFGPRDIEELVKESNKMATFNHPNVLNLIGICTDVGEAPYLVMPLMANGSLLSHLRMEREKLTIAEGADIQMTEETQKRLLSMCLQIAKGMEYLASQNFVHRDLAARNCMIDADFRVKVADFGLSQSLYSKNYFKQREAKGDVKLPVKWMATESLRDGVFSEKSDVWSFGVTCWEVFSLGRSPYPGVHPFSLLMYLETGERLQKPSNGACSEPIYDIMMQCWKDNPNDRPAFKSFVEQLSTLLEGLADYLDLNNLTIQMDGPLDS